MNQWGFNDDGSVNDGSQPNPSDASQGGGLRQFAESQAKENKELKDALASIQKDLRDQKLASVFNSLGVPGAAALYQGDADPVKATEWVTTMKETFGSAGAPAPQTNSATPVGLTPEQQQQLQTINEAGAQGSPLGSMELAQAGVYDASDLNGLIANFQQHIR